LNVRFLSKHLLAAPRWRFRARSRAVKPSTGRPEQRWKTPDIFDSLEPVDGEDPRVMELEPFLEGCLSVLPERMERGQTRLGVLLFLLGAVDRFWALQGLDSRRFQPCAEGLLRRFGLSPDHAATLTATLPRVPEDSFASRALNEGGDTLETWLNSRDPNVALRLTELVAEWRRG